MLLAGTIICGARLAASGGRPECAALFDCGAAVEASPGAALLLLAVCDAMGGVACAPGIVRALSVDLDGQGAVRLLAPDMLLLGVEEPADGRPLLPVGQGAALPTLGIENATTQRPTLAV